ncbi:MAG: hypothetical protein HYZ53_10160 [Planctomycetes bacterium]|nr:hypothetical protein [Planctomycetota bacterium]
MKKSRALMTLAGLAATLAIVAVATPNLGYFIGGDMDSMYEMGKTVGSALGDALGNPIFGLLGIILFIA